MGLRCSLLGHNYGDSDVEREREEQGSEVIVTIREEQTCSRCGKTKLVSENKEVTSLASREGGSGTPGADAASDDGGEDALGDEDDLLDEGDGHDAEIIDGGPSESVPDATREAASVAEADDAPEIDPESAVEPEADPDDDAVILDDSEAAASREPGDREHGEWPDADDTRQVADDDGRAPREWPDAEGEDEGFDAEPADGGPADVEFGGGLAPESAGNAEGDGTMVESADTGFTSADSAPSPVDSDPDREATEFVCPECGHTAAGTGSSLRAGDICPECRRGYIAER